MKLKKYREMNINFKLFIEIITFHKQLEYYTNT